MELGVRPLFRYRENFDDFFFDRIALQFLDLNTIAFSDSLSSSLGLSQSLLDSRLFTYDHFTRTSFINLFDNNFIYFSSASRFDFTTEHPYLHFSQGIWDLVSNFPVAKSISSASRVRMTLLFTCRRPRLALRSSGKSLFFLRLLAYR